MRPLRVLDVAVFLMVGFAVLLPRPDARAKPALALDALSRARVAELQQRLRADRGDAAVALELAELLIDGARPEFAVLVLAPAIERHPDDWRLHLRRALALADHYDLAFAFAAAERARELCAAGAGPVPCREPDQARLDLLHGALARVKDIDARKDPNTVKERLLGSLRPAWWPRQRRAATRESAEP